MTERYEFTFEITKRMRDVRESDSLEEALSESRELIEESFTPKHFDVELEDIEVLDHDEDDD